ncbi:MAG TPA: hypothetical protein VGR35_09665 [Tepidisphaeraceae bacterium]|nr:hypothetical protein [Tepidisphaeraceae bacterium]
MKLPTGADILIVQRTIAGTWDTLWEPRQVRVIWNPRTSLAHVLVCYPDARDTDD